MRIVVAMSGGVDSSVCAHLLKKQGHEVIGITIKTWSNDECRDEKSKGCCSIRDIDDARQVARKLDIPYYVMDLSSDFKEKVIDYFVDEYLSGRTPNPCIECNRHIKFGVLLDKAKELGADYVATGHYAQKGYDEELKRFFIQEAVDKNKDQSYVLFGQTQEQLEKILLPVGTYHKPEIRRMAEELGLRVFEKPDSQEICFVKTSYVDFVRSAAGDKLPGQGQFVDKDGKVLGKHQGFHEYTIGQRKRIHFPKPEPLFVTGIDSQKNQVTIGAESELLCKRMWVGRFNWMLNPRIGPAFAKIRSRHEKTKVHIVEISADGVLAEFETPQKAVTPGQAAVFYDDDKIIGGGWIRKI